ncbi:hypothetical protein KAW38_00395 [Candidatus Micrarchaeota archaeon]|nr:hypothetical protein [Candidatus Micrarchaeota archaeon]
MNKLLIIPLLFGLIVSGCCGLAALEPQMLPTDFCYILETPEIQNICLENAPYIEDDQRIRDYFIYSDTFQSDTDDFVALRDEQDLIIAEYNQAPTSSERKASYNRYYLLAVLLVTNIETTNTHLYNFESFLQTNKPYFDSMGFNTLSTLNEFITLRGTFNTIIATVQLNLETMGEQVALDEQEEQQLNNLLNTLIQLGITLI